MFVVSKRNIIVPSQDGAREFPLPKGFMGEVPAWVSKSPYFKSLVNDGKVIVSKSKKDSDVAAAVEKTKSTADNKSGAVETAGDNSGKGDTETGAAGTNPGSDDSGNSEE